MPDRQQALQRGYLIDGYRIEKLIGGGGFSFVYLAYYIRTKAKVVIKEYFPHEIATRLPGGRVQPVSDEKNTTFQIGLKRFFSEGMALSKLKHPNIVNVSNFFRANDTVFMVMDFEQGRDLRWYIKRSRGKLNEKFLMSVFPPVLGGLRELHVYNFLHLDIKPANILLRTSGTPLLLDFGAVQQIQPGTRYKGVQTLTHGFAPPEQYESGVMGPWSDLYSLGMTMRYCVTGKAPIPSLERLKNDKQSKLAKSFFRKYSKSMLQAIDWAGELDYERRPRSVDIFLEALNNGADKEKEASVLRGWFGG